MTPWIRPVRVDDLDNLLEMIRSVTPGLTTLLVDRDRLLERIERSHFAFTRKSESQAGEPYLLVMEDGSGDENGQGRLIGTATVYGRTGGYEPFYAYRVVTTVHHSEQLGVHDQHRTAFHLHRIYDGPTEIGSLFLLPEFRGAGRGRLLSLARFALIAQRPHRFASRVIAEMRGQCDERGVSPFWEAAMRPFFQVDFSVADALSTIAKPYIEELMPQYPLFYDLLPRSARDVVGQVHPETEAALQLLTEEGFAATDMVDIFDAGPVVQCETQNIKAVRRCRQVTVGSLGEVSQGEQMIIASMRDGFRCQYANVEITNDDDVVVIAPSVASRLAVKVGDQAWLMPPHP